ncbi:MAG: formaldehyde-activating enzyme [Actinobacteria bacterium]|nr:formaldehyde-activating enzyme [Actinomycetota bacterium]
MMQIGESFVGDGVNAAHVNTVLGERDGPVGTAWATALATPTSGHAPFVATLRPSLALTPPTLFVNKAAITGGRHAELTWGAAQAGLALGVRDALADRTIAPGAVGRLVLIAAVWVSPDADDAAAVCKNNRAATSAALRAGSAGRPTVEELIAVEDATNAFYPR